MNVAKIILLCIYGISLLCAANTHGKDRTGKHNFWGTFTAAVIEIGLLWWGGFFG